jgi:hypothetical protein
MRRDAQARAQLISLRIKHESLVVIGQRISTEWAGAREKALGSLDDAGEGYILLSQVGRWWKELDDRLIALEGELPERVRQLK